MLGVHWKHEDPSAGAVEALNKRITDGAAASVAIYSGCGGFLISMGLNWCVWGGGLEVCVKY